MSITIAWNGGENAVCFQPNRTILVLITIIFALGIMLAGGAGVALVGGIGYVVVFLVTLLLSVLSAAFTSTVFSLFLPILLMIVLSGLCIFLLDYIRRNMYVMRPRRKKVEGSL